MSRHAFFEKLACEADPLAFKTEHEPRLLRLRQRLGHLQGKRVLEPGCGAGPLTQRLAEWVGEDGSLLALDPCPGMLARCARQVAAHPHVRVLRAKIEEAEIETRAWDLILCFRLYPHLENADEFLRRCKQWLAEDGELVIANLEGSEQLNALHACLHGVHRDSMPTGDSLRAHMQAHGWRITDVVDEPEEFFLRARRA